MSFSRRLKVSTMIIELTTADITTLKVDGIVNAANSTLLGGGGVDGAIHRAAGPELLEFCRTLCGCETGEAKLSPGFNLPALYVIHTVGPIYQRNYEGDNSTQAALLRSCYTSSLAIASDNQMDAIAFPAISTGVYGYPRDEACEVAVSSVCEWTRDLPTKVLFCCFDSETESLYRESLRLRGITPL